jgi:hypothetical protein
VIDRSPKEIFLGNHRRFCLFVFCPLFFIAASFSVRGQSPNLSSFQEKAQTAVVGGKSIRAIKLSGTAEWFAGSLHENGTAELQANADGSTSVQLNLGQASRTETQTQIDLARTCQWTDNVGKSHEIVGANCLTSIPWFAPGLVAQSPAQLPAILVSTDDGDVLKNGSSFHQISYSLNLAEASTPSTKQLRQATAAKVLFDPQTVLPASLEYAIHPDGDDLRSLDVRVVFSDYRSVLGVMLPFHIERFVNRTLQLKLDISNASVE